MRKSNSREQAQQGSTGPARLNGAGSGSYSAIAGAAHGHHLQNGLDAHGSTASGARNDEGHNPFRYGKEEMLQVYANLAGDGTGGSAAVSAGGSGKTGLHHPPLDYERVEGVAADTLVQPISLTEPDAQESALLAGNINAEQKPRRTQDDARSNGRRGETGGRFGVGQQGRFSSGEPRKVADLQSAEKGSAQTESVSTAREPAFPSVSSGRHQSKFAAMGVFETGAAQKTQVQQDNETSSKWADDKDEDVLKEAMGYGDAGQDVDRLGSLYAKQSLHDTQPATLSHGQQASSQQQPPQQQQSRYTQQLYNPLNNGLPDLFGNKSASQTPSLYGVGGNPLDASRYGPSGTPSPGLPIRQDVPMTTRVMVMPDKLKWQYRDPTGQNQGPFSGLEMHDWYKAGFFQPNLLVKRQEDEDFEPLSILVRRIGNQREPFLVPLPSRVPTSAVQTRPGTADGTKETWPNGQGGHAWSSNGGHHTSNGSTSGGLGQQQTAGASSGTTQPPFPSSFPSFGTTLTAEQQNALERRKQEEQYLMHRQREFLQQQQLAQQMAAQRYMHGQHAGGGNGGYNAGGVAGGAYPGTGMGIGRHGSPFSNGSSERQVTLPYDPNGGGGGGGGGAQHLNTHPSAGTPGIWPSSNLQTGPSSGPMAGFPAQQLAQHQQRGFTDFGVGIFDTPRSEVADSVNQGLGGVGGMAEGHGNSGVLDREGTDQQEREQGRAQQASSAVLEDQGFADDAPQMEHQQQPVQEEPVNVYQRQAEQRHSLYAAERAQQQQQLADGEATEATTQVAAAEEPEAAVQPEEEEVLPVTPAAYSPAPAPWAQAPREQAKSLSLKEIQDLEAKRAAVRLKQERKLGMEAQAQALLQAQVQHASATAPLNLNWAEQATVQPTMQGGLPWKASSSSGKKTLAQIQQEEEAARQRQAALQQQQQQQLAAAGMSSVKLGARYAETASKQAAPHAQATTASTSVGPAWSTVGASGKPAPPVMRAPEPRIQTAPAAAPGATLVPSHMTTRAEEGKKQHANQPADPNAISPEFYKWAQTALLRGLNPGVQFEELLQLLLSFGTDTGKTTQEIISDSIYAHSATLDGRRFAEEFCKRRRQELRSVGGKASVQELSRTMGVASVAGTPASATGASAGGWNDVVKRQKDGTTAPVTETDGWNASVKVQGSKKKAPKRH